jgi:hypothetical protein
VIDGVTQPLTPAWWLNRLATRMWWPLHRERILLLDSWYRGEPPLPYIADDVKNSVVALLGLSRSNFAALLVEALRERVIPVGLRTMSETVDADDQAGWDAWQDAGMDAISADVHQWTFSTGRSYAVVNGIDPDTGAPTVTHEPPTHAITEQDPLNPQRTLAGLKHLHNPILGRDLLYLYLPGETWSAWRPCPEEGMCVFSFSPQTWSWTSDDSGAPIVEKLPTQLKDLVPIVEFVNYGGIGEFELHIDLLARINHTVLQRIVISVMQAFRQRAISGLPLVYPPGHEKAGQEIDYSDVFIADPGAFWQLPADAKMWESQQADLQGVLSAAKDDITFLAAVTRTPMHVLMPEGANQSAEGASLAREGLVFKAEDRIKLLSPRWARVLTLMKAWMGESERVRPGQIIWVPPERASLGERASAVALLKDVPWRTRMEKILQFEPSDVDRMESERADDQLLAANMTVRVAANAGSQVELPKPIEGPIVPPALQEKVAPAPAPKPAPKPAPPPAAH